MVTYLHRAESWTVLGVECPKKDWPQVLISLSHFLDQLAQVKSHHFLVRYYHEDRIFASFRIFSDPNDKDMVKYKLEEKGKKLSNLFLFDIDPAPGTARRKSHGWTGPFSNHKIWGGEETWATCCDFLSRMSKIVVEMAEKGHFDFPRRHKIAHLMVNMLALREWPVAYPDQRTVVAGFINLLDDRWVGYQQIQWEETDD